MTLESLMMTPFFNFMVLAVFSVGFWLETGKICKNNTHVCFIALTFARSLWRCLTTRPDGLMFKQLPRDPTNVNA